MILNYYRQTIVLTFFKNYPGKMVKIKITNNLSYSNKLKLFHLDRLNRLLILDRELFKKYRTMSEFNLAIERRTHNNMPDWMDMSKNE